MDTGPVFLRREEPVQADDDAATLFRRLSAVGEDLLAEGLEELSAGRVIREPQAGEPSSAPKLAAAHALLDFSRPAAELLGKVRGLACGPRARFNLELPGRKLAVQVLGAAFPPRPFAGDAQPGTVLSVEAGGGFIVRCGVGELLVKSVKPEGKKEMPGADFLNGSRIKPGDRLN
jgi:methionyl-tRNA formyltransferase